MNGRTREGIIVESTRAVLNRWCLIERVDSLLLDAFNLSNKLVDLLLNGADPLLFVGGVEAEQNEGLLGSVDSELNIRSVIGGVLNVLNLKLGLQRDVHLQPILLLSFLLSNQQHIVEKEEVAVLLHSLLHAPYLNVALFDESSATGHQFVWLGCQHLINAQHFSGIGVTKGTRALVLVHVPRHLSTSNQQTNKSKQANDDLLGVPPKK